MRYPASALVFLAAVLLAMGLVQPVVYLRRGLSDRTYSVLTGILDLADGSNVLLALIVFLFSVVFPIAKIGALFAILSVRIHAGRRSTILGVLALLGRWSMLDVFVVAILVGSIQLGILADGEPRPGLYLFGAGIVVSMLATMTIERLACGPPREPVPLSLRGGGSRWVAPVACLLFVAGLSLPLMTIEKWVFWENHYSVLGGIWRLAVGGEALLALVIFCFVAVLPLARFVGMLWLQWGAPSGSASRVVLRIDKWAMLDVFGLALMIVIVKIREIASVEPRSGFWVLLVAVGLSLVDSWRLHRASRR